MKSNIKPIDDLMKMVSEHQDTIINTGNLEDIYFESTELPSKSKANNRSNGIVVNAISGIFNASVVTGLLGASLLSNDLNLAEAPIMCNYEIVGDNVNIRMGPSLNFLELYELNTGDLINIEGFVTDSDGDVYQWARFNRNIGQLNFGNYIREDLIEKLEKPKLCR